MPLPIKQTTGFGFLLKTKPVKRSRRLQLFVVRRLDNMPGQLGILVPKRFVKRAVDRHLIKRLVRAAAHSGPFPVNTDVLVRVISPVITIGDSEREQWWVEIKHLLQQQ